MRMHLHTVGSILELVVRANDFTRQFTGFTNGDETDSQLIRDGSAEDEAASLDACYEIDFYTGVALRHVVHCRAQPESVFKETGDVSEENARVWIVRDGPDVGFDRAL